MQQQNTTVMAVINPALLQQRSPQLATASALLAMLTVDMPGLPRLSRLPCSRT